MGLRHRSRHGRQHRRYVLKADTSRQWRLLDLQALDTRLDQIAHRKATLPELAELRVLDAEVHAVNDDLVRAKTALNDVQRLQIQQTPLTARVGFQDVPPVLSLMVAPMTKSHGSVRSVQM